MVHICTLMEIRNFPRTDYSSWTNGLVEVQNINLATHLRMYDNPNVSHSNFTCMLMHTTLNLFQNSMFLHMELFFRHNLEYHLHLISTSTETPLNLVVLNIVLSFHNTLIM